MEFLLGTNSRKKEKLVHYCLNQSAAKTAAELFVIVADPKLWLRSNPRLILWAESEKAPKQVLAYYKKLIPFIYRWGFFGLLTPVKWLIFNVIGLFNPIMRSPVSKRDLQEVTIKSAALACENLVLALAAQGVSSCMMEGFDERRVKSLLPVSNSARVVMVIAAGYAQGNGTWGERYRLQLQEVLHEV